MAETSSSSRPSTWSCTSSNFTTVVSLLRQAETLLQSSVNPVAQQSSAEANECSSSATADQNRSLPYALALPLFRAGWAICWSTDEAQKREWRFCCKRNWSQQFSVWRTTASHMCPPEVKSSTCKTPDSGRKQSSSTAKTNLSPLPKRWDQFIRNLKTQVALNC